MNLSVHEADRMSQIAVLEQRIYSSGLYIHDRGHSASRPSQSLSNHKPLEIDLSMKRRELERFLHEHIPLSRAIGVQVQRSSAEHVVLSAPLTPNINNHSTVFGGSASAVAILAAWSLLHIRLKQAGLQCRLLIQQNTMKYEQPIANTFIASSCVGDDSAWAKFQEMLERKKRARISIKVTIQCRGEKVGEMSGDFVALATLGT
jgi:thioesterase domain-containing protein